MSTYKKLNKQDAYITTYTARKPWAVSGSQFASLGIETFTATGNYLNSLQQLYYRDKQEGIIPTHSFDTYTQTTLNFPDSRNLVTGSFIYSIPRNLFGTHIEPGLEIQIDAQQILSSLYVQRYYWQDSYTEDFALIYSSSLLTILDDKEGNLYVSGSSPRNYVGDIIYTHGIAVITDPDYINILTNTETSRLKWKSNHPIYTHNYHCRLRESEYNFTYNPSALVNSLATVYDSEGAVYLPSASVQLGDINNNITGSSFQPYITTVGLYNDANQLIAVGKMSQPVPKSANTDMTIIVKIDI